MSTLVPPSPAPSPASAEEEEQRPPLPWSRMLLYLMACMLVGGLVWLLWHMVVKLPSYRVMSDSRAILEERGLAAIFSIDAWFVILGFAAGAAVGLAAWWLFRGLGWVTTAMGTVGALVSALACLVVSALTMPPPFEKRLAEASPGAEVPVQFALASPSAVAVWPFAASMVILALASLRTDPEERPLRDRARVETGTEQPGAHPAGKSASS